MVMAPTLGRSCCLLRRLLPQRQLRQLHHAIPHAARSSACHAAPFNVCMRRSAHSASSAKYIKFNPKDDDLHLDLDHENGGDIDSKHSDPHRRLNFDANDDDHFDDDDDFVEPAAAKISINNNNSYYSNNVNDANANANANANAIPGDRDPHINPQVIFPWAISDQRHLGFIPHTPLVPDMYSGSRTIHQPPKYDLIVTVNAARNNTHVNISRNVAGSSTMITHVSGGCVGFVGARRNTFEAAFQATITALQRTSERLQLPLTPERQMSYDYDVSKYKSQKVSFNSDAVPGSDSGKAHETANKIWFRSKGYFVGRDASLRAIFSLGWPIVILEDVTPYSNGGPRPKNMRRV